MADKSNREGRKLFSQDFVILFKESRLSQTWVWFIQYWHCWGGRHCTMSRATCV